MQPERTTFAPLSLAILAAMVMVTLVLSGRAGAEPGRVPGAQGGAPFLISYQGKLTDPNTGQPKPDGDYSLNFKIYDAEANGNLVWSETQPASVSGGYFTVYLGSQNNGTGTLGPATFGGSGRWLEIQVGAETLSPRQRISAVPYALQAHEALNAASLGGQPPSAFATTSHTHDGSEIITGTVAEARIDSAIARDSEITGTISVHAADPSAHHPRYTDAEARAAINGDATHYTAASHAHVHDDRYYTKTESGGLFAPVSHDHDASYYTKTESIALFASVSHNHDASYYPKAESDGRYYTKIESNGLFASISHNHDASYYTKAESDARYASSSQSRPLNPKQVALKRWYAANQSGNNLISIGGSPRGMAFDGANIWVVDKNNGLSKIDSSTGLLSSYVLPAGANDPKDIAYDGIYLWVACHSQGDGNASVTRIDPKNPAGPGNVIPLSGAPSAWNLAHDGRYIWVTNFAHNQVTRVDPATNQRTTYALPPSDLTPRGIAHDGTFLWTANYGSNTVTRVNPTDGSMASFPLPPGAANPYGVAFDGSYIWVANGGSGNITRIDPGSGAGTNFALPSGATGSQGILFDGTYLWVANLTSNNLSRIDPSTGAGSNFALPAANLGPLGLAYDGANVWVANTGAGANSVTKF